MPLRSNLNDLKFGLLTFPANKTFLQLADFNIDMILPN